MYRDAVDEFEELEEAGRISTWLRSRSATAKNSAVRSRDPEFITQQLILLAICQFFKPKQHEHITHFFPDELSETRGECEREILEWNDQDRICYSEELTAEEGEG